MAEERGALEGRLQEAVGRLGAAEQISGHLEQMNAYLQEERERCQQLASQLGREQQGSESRAVEVGRLAALAQQSTEEVMAAREAAQAERSRAERLLHDKAELQGKVGVVLLLWKSRWAGWLGMAGWVCDAWPARLSCRARWVWVRWVLFMSLGEWAGWGLQAGL